MLKDFVLPNGVEEIDQIVNGFKNYKVVETALQMGLFDWLHQKGQAKREEIVEGCDFNGMFSRSFLQALVDLGLLEQQDDSFKNSQLAESFFVKGSTSYQGDWFKMFGKSGSQWDNLTDTLKKQKPDNTGFFAGPNDDFLSSLGQRSLRGELQGVTQAVANWDGFKDAHSVMDLGGGHGLYAIALCQANPSITATVFDKPHVIDTTKKFIKKYNLEDRISVMSGDICTDSWGQGYDIVLVSHLLYKFRKDLDSIFEKLSSSLNQGGLLVTNHWFCSPGCGAGPNGIGELDKSLQSFGHPLCHPEDFKALFGKKGFDVILCKDISSIFGASKLHMAVKNSAACDGEEQSGGCGCCC
ncbi:MAG TPA: hypothetical protein GX534_04090 [Thermoanaerobacterales bacterium]|jgi:SAM-dependent methyltransferase|nr:hypothetical protein [Thermoanaerobacterales bacterium]